MSLLTEMLIKNGINFSGLQYFISLFWEYSERSLLNSRYVTLCYLYFNTYLLVYNSFSYIVWLHRFTDYSQFIINQELILQHFCWLYSLWSFLDHTVWNLNAKNQSYQPARLWTCLVRIPTLFSVVRIKSVQIRSFQWIEKATQF